MTGGVQRAQEQILVRNCLDDSTIADRMVRSTRVQAEKGAALQLGGHRIHGPMRPLSNATHMLHARRPLG